VSFFTKLDFIMLRMTFGTKYDTKERLRYTMVPVEFDIESKSFCPGISNFTSINYIRSK